MNVLPNVIYIGPDKAGSTWLFQALSSHPDVFVTPAKDLYFFDRYYERGLAWYKRQFVGGTGFPVVGEISHDYLYSRPAAQRMHDTLPNVQLLVCLREPVERTFSAYLHLVKTGIFKGSFAAALQTHPGLIERSRYGKWISSYLECYPRNQLHCLVFDELRQDPVQFAHDLWQRLGLRPATVDASLRNQVLPASRSRSVRLTKCTRAVAQLVRDAGFPGLVGRVKSCAWVQRLLYASYQDGQRPAPAPHEVDELRQVFATDLERLDQILGTAFCQRWGYSQVDDMGSVSSGASGQVRPTEDRYACATN
jgi:hypothetical protein